MRTVPPHFLDLAFSELDPALRDEFLDCGVVVDDEVLLDLELLETVSSPHAQVLGEYSSRVGAFWDRYVASGVGGECVVTERTLKTFTKVDKKGVKVFLKDQIAALEALNGLGDALKEIFGGSYDPEKLSALGIENSAEGNLIELRFEVFGKEPWSESLGGAPGRGEIARVFEIKVSHAGSHDRKNQRLLEVRVKVREVWPA